MPHICNPRVLQYLRFIKYCDLKIKKIFCICAAYAETKRGQKLSKVRKVVTPFNFVTPLSFSVTPPSCKPAETMVGMAKYCFISRQAKRREAKVGIVGRKSLILWLAFIRTLLYIYVLYL